MTFNTYRLSSCSRFNPPTGSSGDHVWGLLKTGQELINTLSVL